MLLDTGQAARWCGWPFVSNISVSLSTALFVLAHAPKAPWHPVAEVLKGSVGGVQDYKTPEGKVLSRDLTAVLNTAIQFLVECRPLAITMGNAIKFLKTQARPNCASCTGSVMRIAADRHC